MLILAMLAPTVRQADTNELVAIEPLSWLGSQRAGLNQARATVFCLQLEMLGFELFSWCILNWGKQVGWNCRSSVYFAVGARHLMSIILAVLAPVFILSAAIRTEPSWCLFMHPQRLFGRDASNWSALLMCRSWMVTIRRWRSGAERTASTVTRLEADGGPQW